MHRIVILFFLSILLSCKTPIQVDPRLHNSKLVIHGLDVGYGESILLQSPDNRYILWDGGYPERAAMICDYLKSMNIRKLDLVVNSHPHPDHIGGLTSIITTFKVGKVWGSHPLNFSEIPEDFSSAIRRNKLPYHVKRRGDSWQWTDEILLEILHPRDLVPDMNDSSLVCRISFGMSHIIINSDIGPAAQKELVQLYDDKLKADFMTLPHHGGQAYLPFFKMVAPTMIFLSVGENPWGNPKTETIEYIESMETKLVRTDYSGRAVFKVDCYGSVVYCN